MSATPNIRDPDRCPYCSTRWEDAPGVIQTPHGMLRSVRRDGAVVWLLRCPVCKSWGEIDEDQFHGRVSVDHTDDPGCTFHETHNYGAFVLGGGES